MLDGLAITIVTENKVIARPLKLYLNRVAFVAVLDETSFQLDGLMTQVYLCLMMISENHENKGLQL